MIVLDTERSGLTDRCGIWQIGSLEFENPENYFLEEARIDDGDEIMDGALRVIGKTEAELRDISKQPQKQMIEKYLNWLSQFKERLILGANIAFDIQAIQSKCVAYGLSSLAQRFMGHRGIDISNLAQEAYSNVRGYYLLDKDGNNGMGLSNILDFCGLPDIKISVTLTGEVDKSGKYHNALEDCTLEAECFSRLKLGKSLFPQYSKFRVPNYLVK